MNLNMVEHGLVVSVSFSESEDFDNGPVLAAINALVEALKECDEVSVSISSEYVADSDAYEVLADMENEFAIDQDEDEEDALSEEGAEEESEDEDSDESKEVNLH